MFYVILGCVIAIAILALVLFIISRVNRVDTKDPSVLWGDKKRSIFGLPFTCTGYYATKERLFIKRGFLSQEEDEVRLYRILDLKLTRSLGQRMFGLGTVFVDSSDKSLGNFALKNIKNSKHVKELLSELVEKQRDEKRVVSREFMTGDDSDMYDDDDE